MQRCIKKESGRFETWEAVSRRGTSEGLRETAKLDDNAHGSVTALAHDQEARTGPSSLGAWWCGRASLRLALLDSRGLAKIVFRATSVSRNEEAEIGMARMETP